MVVCAVCDDSGFLLHQVCPLCDGDPSCLEAPPDHQHACDDENDVELFSYMQNGRQVRVVNYAFNRFFSCSFSIAKLMPPRFDADVHLGKSNIRLLFPSLNPEDAQQIAIDTGSIVSESIDGALEAIGCVLNILGIAETNRQLDQVTVSGAASAAEAVCLWYDELCTEILDVSEYERLIHVSQVLPNVFQAHVHSRILLASMFIRPQEYYESPNPSIRGKRCTLAEAKKSRALCENLPFDYYMRWPGFNLPGVVFDAFRNGALGPLEARESALVRSLDAHLPDVSKPGEKYYVIGTCEDAEALHHEMAHGLYHTNDDYRQAVLQVLDGLTSEQKETMREKLLGLGYCDDVDILQDEMQAYMVGGDVLCEGCVEAADSINATFSFYRGDSNAEIGSRPLR
eukprot:TRINITY_DN2857_c1_g1_i1.p1 TRINITY_DN2857_c1_g1~~TRINITY_DN2857_c1_g1_i1.p1  ORF type:complete len:399 (-),score=66.83 TRINITY_DN2857_c1_g1_i1:90-1286(-)